MDKLRAAVPRSRLLVQPNKIGAGYSSPLTVKPAQVAVFTDNHKGTALSLATAGAAASFSFMTRDEFFNMRSDQSVRADCSADADCTLSVRLTPSSPPASQSNRARGGVITLHSANNFFNVAYTLTASGVYKLTVAAVYRLPSGTCLMPALFLLHRPVLCAYACHCLLSGNSWTGLAATFYNGADASAPVFSEISRKVTAISATAPTNLPSELRADEV